MKKFIKRVNLSDQWRSDKRKILPVVKKILSSGEYVGSNLISDLEKKIAKYCGTKFAVCTNSGTDALTLGMYLLNIKKGDEVITPPNSFIASAASIAHLGAKPVFVDVNSDQLIDPIEIEKKISKKTKAIMPVHLCGKMADMKKIMKLSKKYKIPVIEDFAQAIGSKFDKKKSGSYGNLGCFSTHPLKNLNAAGDGGFIVTDNYQYYKKLKLLINHGLSDRNKSQCFAYVSRMDTLQAGILLERLKNLNSRILLRRKNAEVYFKELKNLPIRLPYENKDEFNSYHLFVIQTNLRNKLHIFLKKKGIESGIHYPIPIHLQPAAKYLGYKKGDFKNTEKQSKTILSLPINEFLKKNEIIYVCRMIKNFFNEK